ncbi:MAG TPA: YDG domain-containing protein, partial [Marinilabiliaceae bacterium]|nr:YDG domain-containing protein [Marinilabiliaceae bacterium]
METTYNGFDHPVIVEVTNTFKSAKIEYDYGDGIWVATAPRDAGNYRVRATSEDDTYVGDQIKILTINKKSIPAATFEAVTKEFDNTTNVSDQPTLILDGILSGDKVTASGDAAKYDNKNAGENKTVTINNIKLDGDDAANYTIPQTATNDKCSITKLDYGKVPLVFSFPAQSKVFDGTTSVKKNGVEEIPSITISGF